MGGAHIPKRRNVTARQAAEKFGVSTRTVQKFMAEPREEYLSRAQARRQMVVNMRISGMKIKDIAQELNMSIGGVSTILHKEMSAGRLTVTMKYAPPPKLDPYQKKLI